MTLVEFWAVLTTIVGAGMSGAYISQIYKMWKNKSSKDVSLITYSILTFGLAVWLVYGFLIDSVPLIVANTVGTIAGALVIAFWFKYRR